MKDADLITLAEREAQRLGDENDHGAAVIMRALIERVRSKLVPFNFASPSIKLHTGGIVSEPAVGTVATTTGDKTVVIDTKGVSLSKDEVEHMMKEAVKQGLRGYRDGQRRGL